jgi:UPF0755 protein
MLTVPMLDTKYRRSARHRARRGSGSRRGWGPFIGLLVTLGLVGAAALGAVGYYQWCQGAGGPQDPVTLEVPEGATGSDVIGLLHENEVIRCDLVSKFVVRQRGLSDQFIAGTYDLTTNMQLDEVLTILTTPNEPVETFRFTTPEGFTVKQIGEKAGEELGLNAGIFAEAGLADNRWSLPPYLPEDNLGAEGFLFPRSYEFVVGTRITPKKLIQTMLAEFEEEVADMPWQRARRLGVTPYEIVIIASMIEEETVVPEERALVAAVIYNRLEQGGPLGIDATLIYVDPNPEDGLTDADLAIDSPYNTRINAGLPPTPISNPGAASIQAALQPADTDFFYYVLCPQDGDGVHRFAKTLAEHNANVATCLG